jgi:hypothetical protein
MTCNFVVALNDHKDPHVCVDLLICVVEEMSNTSAWNFILVAK